MLNRKLFAMHRSTLMSFNWTVLSLILEAKNYLTTQRHIVVKAYYSTNEWLRCETVLFTRWILISSFIYSRKPVPQHGLCSTIKYLLLNITLIDVISHVIWPQWVGLKDWSSEYFATVMDNILKSRLNMSSADFNTAK